MSQGIPKHKKLFGRPCKNCGGILRYGRSYSCVVCTKRNSEERKKSEKYKKYARNYESLKRYGITREQVQKLLEMQEGKCAICSVQEPGNKNGWCIDHCHVSGKLRGILCHGCNVGLGGFKDNIVSLQAAVEYIKMG